MRLRTNLCGGCRKKAVASSPRLVVNREQSLSVGVGTENESSELKAPLGWRLRSLALRLRVPLVFAVLLAAWFYIPQFQARSQQQALADEFFKVCRKMLKDTAQLPNVPDDALQEAIKNRPVTQSALSAWSPEVSTQIRKGQWVARIQFSKSANYTVEETIGPALADAGYDSP